MKDDASAAEVGGRFEEADDRLPEGRGGPKPKPWMVIKGLPR